MRAGMSQVAETQTLEREFEKGLLMLLTLRTGAGFSPTAKQLLFVKPQSMNSSIPVVRGRSLPME